MLISKSHIAPQFTLQNENGIAFSLTEIVSQTSPLLLIFYKFNCPTCQFAFQYLPEIANALGNGHFVAIAQDNALDIKAFKSKYAVGFEILSDPYPYEVSIGKYGIDFVPTCLVIEKDKSVSEVAVAFDKKFTESFSNRLASLKKISSFSAFKPTDQVPLLKPG